VKKREVAKLISQLLPLYTQIGIRVIKEPLAPLGYGYELTATNGNKEYNILSRDYDGVVEFLKEVSYI
jgi:hypothetical protein